METIFNTISDYLLNQSLQITALFTVVFIINFLLSRSSSHVRYLLWLLLLAKCIFPSVIQVSLAILPQKQQPEQTAEAVNLASPVPQAFTTTSASVYHGTFEETAVPDHTLMDTLKDLSPQTCLTILWIACVSLFLITVSIRAYRLNRKLRTSRKPVNNNELLSLAGKTKLWQIEQIAQPFVWGLLRGSIYLPDDFLTSGTSHDRHGILMHELAHIKRFDAGVNLLQIIAQAIFWFHPLVWISNSKIRQEREKCCDESAIANLKTAPEDYGKAIVETLAREYQSGMPTPALAVTGPARNIEDRIKTIMCPDKKFYKRCGFTAMAAVLLLALISVPTGLALTTSAETPDQNIRKYVRLVFDVDNNKASFQDRTLNTDSLEKEYTSCFDILKNKENTVLEWAFAPGTKPQKNSMSWLGFVYAINELSDLVKKHGLAGMCFANEMPLGTPETIFAAGTESNFSFNEDLTLNNLTSGPIKLQSIKFEAGNPKFDSSGCKALIKTKVSSCPKTKWEIRLELRQDDIANTAAVYETFENSGKIAGVAVISDRTIEIPLDGPLDRSYLEDVKNFEIRIRQISIENTKPGNNRITAVTDYKEKQNELFELYGLDLSKSSVTTNPYELADLYRKIGNNQYTFRWPDTKIVYQANEGIVFYVPNKNVFYVQKNHPPAETAHYYGPFTGNPQRIIKKLPKGFGRIYYHGLSIPENLIENAKKAGAKIHYNKSELPELFKKNPKNPKQYKLRDETVIFQKFYYLPSRNIFYKKDSMTGFTNSSYFGPLPGDPRTMAVQPDFVQTRKKQVSIESRFITVSPEFLEDTALDVSARLDLKAKINYKPHLNTETTIRNKTVDESISIYCTDASTIDFLVRTSNAHADSKCLPSPKILLIDGESGIVSVGKEDTFIAGYQEDPSIPGQFNRIIETIDSGFDLKLLPIVLKNPSDIELQFDLDYNDLQGFEELKHKSGKTFNLPLYNKMKMKGQIIIPEGRTLLIIGPEFPVTEKEIKINSKQNPEILHKGPAKIESRYMLITIITPKIIDPDK